MQDPRVQVQLTRQMGFMLMGDQYIDKEEDYRNKLLENEKGRKKIAPKQMKELKVLKSFDIHRAEKAAKMDQRTSSTEHRRRCTCSICNQIFTNANAKNQHYQDVHCLECDYCYKSFKSRHALAQHKDAVHGKGHLTNPTNADQHAATQSGQNEPFCKIVCRELPVTVAVSCSCLPFPIDQ
jgi:hypothetical protein